MTTPKVSICLPTYNRARTLRYTIEAMLRQTYSDWELIIGDDASIDNTEEVAKSYIDRRIQYFRNPVNLGLYPNWHQCMARASGAYIAIYHDHDVYMPTIIERSVALLDRHPNASFVHTALLFIDDQNVPVGVDIRPFAELTAGEQVRRLLTTNWSSPVMAPTAMVRRSAYDQVGPYRYQEYGLGCDLNMWFRLCRVGDMAYIPEPQAFVRARVKGQYTAQIRWADVLGVFRMRRDHIREVFECDRAGYYQSIARYTLERDLRLLTLGLRAILLEPPELVTEGERIMGAEGSFWVGAICGLINKSTWLRGILKKRFLPAHYRSLERKLELDRKRASPHRLQVETYVASLTGAS